jgi:hypothetical protein
MVPKLRLGHHIGQISNSRKGVLDMSKTLTAGEHKLVFTRGVNDRIADDSKFAAFVWKSLLQFNRGDWGGAGAEDWTANDDALDSLNNGGRHGRILAAYRYTTCFEECHRITIWIIRNVAEVDGTQAITVLFPSDY